jgi:hypothetical protein
MRKIAVSLVLLTVLPITAAHAYIGPGAGAGTIAVILGILSSIFLAFVGIVWYPIKRLFRGRKGKVKSPGPGQPGSTDPGATVGGSKPASPAAGAQDSR